MTEACAHDVFCRDDRANPEGLERRYFAIERSAVDEEKRTVSLAFSSEAPILRYFGMEILDHGTGSVRLDRLREAGPLLLDHDRDKVIGVVESVEIGNDRKARAVVRFSKSALGSEILADVVDGIRKSVSVSYRIHKQILEKKEEDLETYRATDWEPLEISLVSIPADTTVGVGRAESGVGNPAPSITIPKQQERTMNKCTKCGTEHAGDVCPVCQAREARAREVADMLEIGRQYNQLDLAARCVSEGKNPDELRRSLLEVVGKAKPVENPDPSLGMSAREVQRFSIVRAINAKATGDWTGAEFEREVSAAAAKKLGKSPQGFFVPYDVLTERRDLSAGVANAGGYTMATQMLAASFIDMLRNKMVVRALGARILGGLVGDIAIPKQTGGATAYWVAEGVAPTESQQTFGQAALTPKTVGAFTDLTRKLIMQSSIDVESFVRMDLAVSLALAIDLAAINGLGAAGQPRGILKTTGIGDVAGGTNGANPTFSHIVSLETEVAADNADIGSLAYLTTARIRGRLKTTEKASSTAQYVWSDSPTPGVGVLNGYPALVSNQVPADLVKGAFSTGSAIIFGNWSDLIIGEWGALDILVDPYTGGAAGTVRVRVLQDVDTVVRHAESFAAMQDAAY